MNNRKMRDMFRTTTLTALALISFASTAHSAVGTGDIGGGAGVVCRDSNKNVIFAEMLEISEGKVRKLKIPSRPESVEEQIKAAAGRLESFALGFFDYYENTVWDIAKELQAKLAKKDGVEFLEEDLVIHTPPDLGRRRAIPLKNGCTIEAVGYYEAGGIKVGGKLKISKLLYDKLDNTNKAAFWIHEALYSLIRRRLGSRVSLETGTEHIRDLVAALFASNTELEQLIVAFRPLALKNHREENNRNPPPMVKGGYLPSLASPDSIVAFIPEASNWGDEERSTTRLDQDIELTEKDTQHFHCDAEAEKGFRFSPKPKKEKLSTLAKNIELQGGFSEHLGWRVDALILPKSCLLEGFGVVPYLGKLKGDIVVLKKVPDGKQTYEKRRYEVLEMLTPTNGDPKVPYVALVLFLKGVTADNFDKDMGSYETIRQRASYPWTSRGPSSIKAPAKKQKQKVKQPKKTAKARLSSQVGQAVGGFYGVKAGI